MDGRTEGRTDGMDGRTDARTDDAKTISLRLRRGITSGIHHIKMILLTLCLSNAMQSIIDKYIISLGICDQAQYQACNNIRFHVNALVVIMVPKIITRDENQNSV